MLGGALGGIVDPVKIKGPRLTDGQTVTSQEGIPIPFGYGTFPIGGNVIWADRLVEHKHKEGGKGGPQTTTYTYTRSYAVGICEGEITAIQKAWRNGKLVYDISEDPTTSIPDFPGLLGVLARWVAMKGANPKFLANHKFYTGSETQTVDPTIEAVVGVGNSPPMRGLAYMVAENEDLTDSGGAIAQWRFVVQMCGTVTTSTRTRFLSSGGIGGPELSETGATWAQDTDPTIGTDSLRGTAANGSTVVAGSNAGKIYRSTNSGSTWALVQNPGVVILHITRYGSMFVGVSASHTWLSVDDGVTWTQHAFSPGGGNYITSGNGKLVAVGTGGVYYSTNGTSWALGQSFSAINVGFNGTHFMAVGNNGANYSSADGVGWTAGTSPIAGHNSFAAVTGQDGYFLAGAFAAVASWTGIWKTTDLGASWTRVYTAGIYFDAASGDGYDVMTSSGGGGSLTAAYSSNAGVTWATSPSSVRSESVIFLGPADAWYPVPDAPGVYSDEDGNVVTDYADGSEVSGCGAYLDDIVGSLCERAGIEPSEYDVTDLAGTFVKGYGCATESSAQGFIEPLTQAFFFDRGEWDKKVRFIMRGGASIATLDPDDLVAMDGPAIVQTRVQEVELLRKVNVMTVDPDAEFNMTKQSWERRVGTIQAKGEASVEIPIITDRDTAAQIAEKRGKVAWAETDKFAYGLTLAHSALTPTDVVNLTDKAGVAHRQRIQAQNEESGIITIEEAMKDRASTYESAAVGVVNTNIPVENAEQLIGATLFTAMALPMLRSQDNTPGMYVGACGMLDGWAGCQILMSVDGGVSYSAALTITTPTIMGSLTADCTSSSEPISVRVFGGQLESKTTAQVDVGQNWFAVQTAGVAEILSAETATPTGDVTYDLTNTVRGVDDTTAAAHSAGDPFMDLSTAYYLPIPQDFAGSTLYFKAVGLGVSADAVDAVAVDWAGVEYIIDGGGA